MSHSPFLCREWRCAWYCQCVWLSEVIVSDVLDSGHLPVLFHILDHVRTRNLFDPIEKFTDWEWLQSLSSDLLSPRTQINSGIEANKAAHGFTAIIASSCRLSTSKITLLDLNRDLPGLDRLLKHKQKPRKLWHETRDPLCKMAVKWVTKINRRMTWRKALK
jgi:hypothetical protein